MTVPTLRDAVEFGAGWELLKPFGFVMTEEQVLPWADERDIDLAAFAAHLRATGLRAAADPDPTIEDLLHRAVIGDLDGTLRPTLYGLLAFGKRPQRHPQMGNFVVRCAAGADSGADVADGPDADAAAASKSGGRLDQQVRRSLRWAHSAARRDNFPRVPRAALREALVNAVAHRDYCIVDSPVLLHVLRDRIVVASPGSLPHRMTAASVRAGARPRSRNELMASALAATGLMDRRGLGWRKISAAMAQHGLPAPRIDHDRNARTVRVTLLRAKIQP